MAVELELILRFERDADVPTQEDIESELDCTVIEYIREDM